MATPITQTLGTTEARQQFSTLLNQVFRGETRVVVEENGIPVAAIVSAEDLELLQLLDHEREKDFTVFSEISRAFQDVPLDELEREVAQAVTQARAKIRRERDEQSRAR